MISRHSTSSSLYISDIAAWIPAFLQGSIRSILTLPARPFGFHYDFCRHTITIWNTPPRSSLHSPPLPKSLFSSGLDAIHCVASPTSTTLPLQPCRAAKTLYRHGYKSLGRIPSLRLTSHAPLRPTFLSPTPNLSPRYQFLPILTRPSSEEFGQRIPNLRAIFGSKLTPPSRAAFELAGLNNNMIYDSDLAMARGSAKIECQVHQVSRDRQIGHAFLLFILSGKSTSLSVLLSQWSLLLSLPFLYIERYTISIPHNKLQRYLQQYVSPPPFPSRLHRFNTQTQQFLEHGCQNNSL